METRAKSRKLIAATLRKDLYCSIRIVANPPCDTQQMGFALDKPAKTDALHATANQKAPGLNRSRFGIWAQGFKIAESGSGQIHAFRGIDLDLFALVDEGWYLND